MKKEGNNYAFIDGQNLYVGIKSLGWNLDYQRFRIYLAEKYAVSKAFLFIGYVEKNAALYKSLQDIGYICIFKPTLRYRDGTTKGNCDAELVLQTMIELENFDAAIISTGDGDFHCLINYLHKQKKLEAVLIPNRKKFSALLKVKTFQPFLRFLDQLQNKLAL